MAGKKAEALEDKDLDRARGGIYSMDAGAGEFMDEHPQSGPEGFLPSSRIEREAD